MENYVLPQIVLKFKWMDIRCPYDLLGVFIEDTQLLRTFCGNQAPADFPVPSNRAKLVFYSNPADRGGGFAFEYTSDAVVAQPPTQRPTQPPTQPPTQRPTQSPTQPPVGVGR